MATLPGVAAYFVSTAAHIAFFAPAYLIISGLRRIVR